MGLIDMIEFLSGDFASFSEIMGKTAVSVERVDGLHDYNEGIRFVFGDESVYHLVHHQDCCESVYIEDIEGDLDNLVGSPITMADESYSEGEENDYGSSTWSFYRFATVKGYATIRFYGSSNGYYSESAGFYRVA
jgi:hypothetical protein